MAYRFEMNLQPFDNNQLNLFGSVVAGRGIAASVVKLNQEKIEKLLGAVPYPGTLNIVTKEPFLLKQATQIDTKGKQFAVPAHIEGIPCIIYRWHGAPLHIVEVIAAAHLRNTLDLKDGQMVNITVSKDKVLPPGEWRSLLWRFFYQERPQVYYNDDLYKLFTSIYFKSFHKKVCQRKSEFVS